ncbi:uncharacterized protein VP01_5401g1, partial [Puccinia sorghi]
MLLDTTPLTGRLRTNFRIQAKQYQSESFIILISGTIFTSLFKGFHCRVFRHILELLVQISPQFIISPPANYTHGHIKSNPKFSSLFNMCLGVLDGVYVPVWKEKPTQKVTESPSPMC